MHASSWWGALAVAAVLALSGCKDSKDEKKDAPASGGGGGASTPPAEDEHAGHDHTAPHGGDLIELGNEEYHAELVHDEAAHKITIYLLDGHAEKAVAIADKSVTINLKIKGKPQQVALPADPDAGDPAGKSLRFVLADEDFADALDAEDAAPSLSLKIDGKSYKGKIVHDHEGHDHAHE